MGLLSKGICFGRYLPSPGSALTSIYITFLFLFISGAGMEPSPLLLRQRLGLLYQPRMVDADDCGATCGINEWQGKPKYLEETSPNAPLSTTNPTRLELGSNPGRLCVKPVTNHLSYGTVVFILNLLYNTVTCLTEGRRY
jgi:hypothetical protein